MVKPHLLLINPNTSADITQTIHRLALAEIGEQAQLTAVTAPFGASYIATRTAVTIAAHAVLDAYAQASADGRKYDAVVVACFGDPGIDALKEITSVPVLGFADSGLTAAAAEPGAFAIATIGTAWRDMLSELALRRGLADRLAGIISIDENGRAPEIAGPKITAAAQALGVSRVILGGTGLIAALDAIAARVAVSVIDPHRVTLHAAVRAAADGAQSGRVFAPASPFAGLSPALLNVLQTPPLA